MSGNGDTEKARGDYHAALLDWEFDLAPIRSLVGSLKSPIVIPAARSYLTNMENIDSLLMMPGRIAAEGVKDVYWAAKFMRTYTDEVTTLVHQLTEVIKGNRARNGVQVDYLGTEERTRQATKLFLEFLSKEGTKEEFASRIHDTVLRLMREREFEASIRVLLMSATTLLWTAFECLVADLWVSSLNSGKVGFAHRAFRSVAGDLDQDGISSKQIEVWILAKYGFDLRNHLGTLLGKKFRFSDLEGIRRAYTAAFEHPGTFDRILGKEKLKNLESYRHLIVHRSATVDEKFKAENSGIMQAVGEALYIDGRTVSDFGSTCIETAADLLTFIEQRPEFG